MSQPEQGPMVLDPQVVVDELLAIPEARPYWALAQERTARKMLERQVEQLQQALAAADNEQAPAENGSAEK